MKRLPVHFPPLQDRNNPDHAFLVKLIPFVGPGDTVPDVEPLAVRVGEGAFARGRLGARA